MIQTHNFEIAIPKEYLKTDGFFNVQTQSNDFRFKVTVHYQCEANGDRMEIYRQSTNFLATRYINWDLKLEEYFLEAAKNNWENLHQPKQNDNAHPVFTDILNNIIN